MGVDVALLIVIGIVVLVGALSPSSNPRRGRPHEVNLTELLLGKKRR